MEPLMAEPAEQVVQLYQAQRKLHPREVTGRFNQLRVKAAAVLLGIFYGLPWLKWNEHQALLFDLPARKFHVFGLTFFPQDFFLLSWLLIIAALSLFFFTALAGRLWCGYACPQTVWTQVFVWMEQLTEGNWQQRIKLDKAPWSTAKLLRKGTKQVLWICFSLFTGYTFVGYFTPVHDLTRAAAALSLGGWELFWILFYGFATYGNAGYLREQVCKYMCPYARFQGAMFDRNTLVIAYDAARGDPRGSRPRNVDPRARGLGDCIDCKLCVQACPTGIDIRKGLQLECIACAACIDACDSVMDQMPYPRGLIRYSTLSAIEQQPSRLWRPRIAIYSALLAVLILGFGTAIAMRDLMELDVLRDRNALYRILGDGRIENVYTVRIVNKDNAAHAVQLRVTGLPAAEWDSDASELQVPAGAIASTALRLRVPAGSVTGSVRITVVATAKDQPSIAVSSPARFMGPVT
jgi:cytochrome c oxidase accessory protein FixG